jgi:hypothetical protein
MSYGFGKVWTDLNEEHPHLAERLKSTLEEAYSELVLVEEKDSLVGHFEFTYPIVE